TPATCLIEATKRVRVERIVRRDHPAEMTAPQDDGQRAWQPGRHANRQWRTTIRLAPARLDNTLLAYCSRSYPPGVAMTCHAVPRGPIFFPKTRGCFAAALTRLTPELSRAAKRRRLE